ncbi:hypothetical protein GCM10023115_25030 [Pontixanthobacter gangjinensis]|uniref:Uncharacterized protein n=1 Tax=Christiangramia aestuarii TaxID=1028746 RepID=A0A7K1LT02_9FLAO|nr:hypothetical protein [Christiangramia aestuarii]MUP43933.1 hypothetical protein [Christiangramia aestuarii]
MDLIGVIIGQYLLEFIGASIRYIFNQFKSILFPIKKLSFSDYWSPNSDLYQRLETEVGNRIAGGMFLVIVLIIIFYF